MQYRIALETLVKCKQKEDETPKDFFDRHQGKVDVIKNYGLDLGAIMTDYKQNFKTSFPNLRDGNKKMTYKEIQDHLNRDEERLTELKEEAMQRLISYGMLHNCNKKRNGNLVEDLANTYVFGNDKYPKTPQKAYEFMMKHKNSNLRRKGIIVMITPTKEMV